MKEKQAVKQVFSKNKEAYVTSHTHAKGSDLALLTEWLHPKVDMLVLDIATGGGHVAKQLSPNVKTVFATDLTKEMLENTANYLQAFSNIHYVIADAEELPFLDHTFDLVTCRIAAHHFPNPEAFIKEVGRVLKSNGKFLFIDNVAAEVNAYDQFINKLDKMRDYSHGRSLRISEWERHLSRYHLTIMKQEKRKKTLPYQEWSHRTLERKDEIEQVNQFIINASEEIKDYYHVKIKHGEVQSFAIDEWMVLCEK